MNYYILRIDKYVDEYNQLYKSHYDMDSYNFLCNWCKKNNNIEKYEYYTQKKKDQEKQIEISTENFNNYLHKILKIDRATTPIIWNIPNLNDRRVFVSWKGL